MLRSAAILILASPIFLSAPVPKSKVNDADAILGNWKLVAVQNDGMPAAKDVPNLEATIVAEKITVHPPGGDTTFEVAYKLNSGTGWIDLNDVGDVGEAVLKGVYKLSGDTLIVVIGKDEDAARPKEAVAGAGFHYFKLTRIRGEKK